MTLFQSIILGFVQGATEFLPVSSSGHLAIFKYLFGLSDVGIAYDILLHVGTLLAVFAIYYKDIWQLIVNAVCMLAILIKNFFAFLGNFRRVKKKYQYQKIITTPYRKFVALIIVSIIPVGLVGFLLGDWIESISAGLLVPGICLLITGAALYLSEKLPEGTKTAKNLTYKNALIIGAAQACAAFPGISRSGSTICASLAVGMKRTFAVKYSFIMSIPVILGAALKSLKDLSGTEISGGEIGVSLIGMVVAAVVGFIAIKLLLLVVKNNKFRYFAFYCFAVGLLAIIGSFCI